MRTTAKRRPPSFVAAGVLLFATVAVAFGLLLLRSQTAAPDASAHSQVPVPSGWVATGGDVNDVATTSTTTYLGGAFTYVGPFTGIAAALDPTTAALTTSQFGGLGVSTARSIISDGSGGWYVGGQFNDGSGVGRPDRLAHINSDGSIDQTFDLQLFSTVTDMLLDGTTLYIVGQFTQVLGTTRNRAAAIDLTSRTLLSWNPNASSDVNAIAKFGSTIYLGGNFTTINGGALARTRLAAVDATTGTGDAAWAPSANSTVNDLAVSGNGDTVYAAGAFSAIGATSRNSVAAINPADGVNTGTLFGTWNPNVPGGIETMLLTSDDATLYFGGAFTSVGGNAALTRLAAVNADPSTAGAAFATFDADPSGTVRSLALNGSDLFVGGDFTTIDSASRNRVAAVDSSTGGNGDVRSWTAANDATTVRALAIVGGVLMVGGDQSSIGGASRTRFAALDATTNSVLPLDLAPDATVEALAVSGSDLYVAGQFANIGGQARNRLAQVDTGSGTVTTWNPNVTGGTVEALAVAGDDVYLGGAFTTVGVAARSRLAHVTRTNDVADAWDPGAGATITRMDVDGTNVYVGGTSISPVGGAAYSGMHVMAVDRTSGTAAAGWDPVFAGGGVQALDLSPDGAVLYLGGQFSAIDGAARTGAGALTASTGTATAWAPAFNGPVTGVLSTTSGVFAGGTFSAVTGSNGGFQRSGLALFGTDGSVAEWSVSVAAAGNGILALKQQDNVLHVGGSISSAGFDRRFGYLQVALTQVAFGSASASGAESTPGVSIPVTLSQADPLTTTISYAATGGTATAGVDFVLSGSSAVVPAGTTSFSLPLSIVNDTTDEPDETVVVTLTGVDANGVLGTGTTYTYTIQDEDVAAANNAPEPSPSPTSDSVTVVERSTPIDEAIALSQAEFSAGAAGAVVLARSDTAVDAFTSAPLAALTHAAMLLTDPADLPGSVLQEIDRVLGSTSKPVYIVGGTAAVGESVAAELQAHGLSVTRIAGAQRRATARSLAEALDSRNVSPATTVYLTDDQAFVDAYSISPVASQAADGLVEPILVSRRGSSALDADVATYLAAHPAVTTVRLIGGTAALPSAMEQTLQRRFPLLAVQRTAGATRFATNRAILDEFFPAPTRVLLVRGDQAATPGSSTSFSVASAAPYAALLAGNLAASLNAPVVLFAQNAVPDTIADYLVAHHDSIVTLDIIFQTGTVNQNVIDRLTALAR